jgi:hypothetical protein
MNEELNVDRLDDMIHLIDHMKQAIVQSHTKFQVALANSLRLFSEGANGTLSKLHGTEEDLMSYLLKLSKSLQQEFESRIESLRSELSEIIKNTKNP